MIRSTSKLFLGIAVAIAAVTAAMMLTVASDAQAQFPFDEQAFAQEEQRGEPEESQADVMVGTYNPQAVFEQHPAHARLIERMGTIQSDMQTAAEEGNQQMMGQLQQQYEQERMHLVEQFQQDVAEAIPDVAEAADVKIVALEIVYTDKDVETMDITPLLIEATAEEDVDVDEPVAPSFPEQESGWPQ